MFRLSSKKIPPNCNFAFELHEKPLWPDPITNFFRKKNSNAMLTQWFVKGKLVRRPIYDTQFLYLINFCTKYKLPRIKKLILSAKCRHSMTFFKDFFSDIGMSLDSFVNNNMYKIDTESIWQINFRIQRWLIYESFNCFSLLWQVS